MQSIGEKSSVNPYTNEVTSTTIQIYNLYLLHIEPIVSITLALSSFGRASASHFGVTNLHGRDEIALGKGIDALRANFFGGNAFTSTSDS